MHFNSEVNAITNERYYLNDSIEKVKYFLDAWINEGSGSVIDKVEGIYILMSLYMNHYQVVVIFHYQMY